MKTGNHLIFAISIFFWLFLTAMNAQNILKNNDFDQTYKRFKTLYEQELKQAGIVGSSFVFLKDNKILAREFYGSANLEKNQTTNEDTIYHWASNTKPLTGIAIMQLRDRGLLKLDDPIIKYLPELKTVHNPFGEMQDITIRQLMNHSAGFRGSTFPYKNGKE
ncbi:MAG: beta-lactamase family protein, partial [Pyrinomonadaceae bacterium]|nr:beta-lactamase family protein [Pyrinomonadaceae bacterium]